MWVGNSWAHILGKFPPPVPTSQVSLAQLIEIMPTHQTDLSAVVWYLGLGSVSEVSKPKHPPPNLHEVRRPSLGSSWCWTRLQIFRIGVTLKSSCLRLRSEEAAFFGVVPILKHFTHFSHLRRGRSERTGEGFSKKSPQLHILFGERTFLPDKKSSGDSR